MADAIGRPSVVPLPATKEDMLAGRKTKMEINLNNQIEAIHISIYGRPDYMQYFDGVYDEDCVEGSIAADDQEIARIFRAEAKEKGDAYVEGKKLHTIVKSLKVVWRRYGIDRMTRRGTVGGVAVTE